MLSLFEVRKWMTRNLKEKMEKKRRMVIEIAVAVAMRLLLEEEEMTRSKIRHRIVDSLQ